MRLEVTHERVAPESSMACILTKVRVTGLNTLTGRIISNELKSSEFLLFAPDVVMETEEIIPVVAIRLFALYTCFFGLLQSAVLWFSPQFRQVISWTGHLTV